jgi:hypothetical protein
MRHPYFIPHKSEQREDAVTRQIAEALAYLARKKPEGGILPVLNLNPAMPGSDYEPRRR